VTPRMKKIVAREGLIMIGVIVVSALIMKLSNFYPPIPELSDTEKSIIENIKDINQYSTAERFLKNLPYDDRVFFVSRYHSLSKEAKKVVIERISGQTSLYSGYRLQEKRDKIFDIGLFVLIIGYPLYLVGRFIMWALRIMNKK